jgi:hypothetical protein
MVYAHLTNVVTLGAFWLSHMMLLAPAALPTRSHTKHYIRHSPLAMHG